MAQTGARNDPFFAFRFKILFDGAAAGGFSDCSGLQLETEVQDYAEGGLNCYMRKFPGRVKQSNIVLKRGVVDRGLWDWYFLIAGGGFLQRDGSILVYDPSGKNIVMSWNFAAAFPNKWQGPDLNASRGMVAVETLELCHQGLERLR